MGGDLVVHTIAPLVDLSVTTPGGHFHKTGLGDMTVGLGTGFHYSPKLHAVFALDVMLPTGGYDKAQPSIGRNYLAFEPVVAVTR